MQSTDPNIGPENIAQGWRPDQSLDPRIMVDKSWAPMFTTLRPEIKQAVTESLLSAWLDKTLAYPPATYFRLGLLAGGSRGLRTYKVYRAGEPGGGSPNSGPPASGNRSLSVSKLGAGNITIWRDFSTTNGRQLPLVWTAFESRRQDRAPSP